MCNFPDEYPTWSDPDNRLNPSDLRWASMSSNGDLYSVDAAAWPRTISSTVDSGPNLSFTASCPRVTTFPVAVWFIGTVYQFVHGGYT